MPSAALRTTTVLVGLAVFEPGCDGEAGACEAIESGGGRITVGFWDNDDCSGEPLITNSFPVDPDAPCYCWPGSSGENSADGFSCDPGGESFTYVQYNSLTCGDGDDTPTTKVVYTTACTQDIPPTLSAMVLDDSACE